MMIGKNISAVVCLSALALSGEDFPVRVNQAGYLPHAGKICTMKNPPSPKFFVLTR